MFGCSTNQYAGNGEPTTVTPAINSVNHSTTYGSSSGTEGPPPPMASSYSSPAAPSVNVDALATLAADRGFRGYVLGPVNPGGAQQGVAVASGQFESPANAVLPQETVNSSINSQPTPAITGGDVVVAGATTGGASPIPTLTGGTTTAAATTGTVATTPTSSAATSALTNSTGSATVAGSAAFSPVMMNSTPAPQATGTTGPTLRNVVATGRVVTGTTTRTTGKTAASAVKTTTAGTATATVSSGIQLQTSQSGGIVMTNVSVPATKGSSNK